MEEDLREAARAAAAAASETLARSDFGGRSASVDFSVSFDVRTVPQSTPAGRFVEVFDLDQLEPVFEDTGSGGEDFDSLEDVPDGPDFSPESSEVTE